MPKIFGREPAVLVGLVETIIPVLVAIGVLTWSTDQVGAVMAASSTSS